MAKNTTGTVKKVVTIIPATKEYEPIAGTIVKSSFSGLGITDERLSITANVADKKVLESECPQIVEKVIQCLFNAKDSLLDILSEDEFLQLTDRYLSHIAKIETSYLYWEYLVAFWTKLKSLDEMVSFLEKHKKQYEPLTIGVFINMGMDLCKTEAEKKNWI